MISLWSGKVDELQSTTINNWQAINQLLKDFNQSCAKSPILAPLENEPLDTTKYDVLNRDYRNVFLKNAGATNVLMKKIYQQLAIPAFNYDIDFQYQEPVIPQVLYFDENIINAYWRALKQDFDFIIKTLYTNQLI